MSSRGEQRKHGHPVPQHPSNITIGPTQSHKGNPGTAIIMMRTIKLALSNHFLWGMAVQIASFDGGSFPDKFKGLPVVLKRESVPSLKSHIERARIPAVSTNLRQANVVDVCHRYIMQRFLLRTHKTPRMGNKINLFFFSTKPENHR